MWSSNLNYFFLSTHCSLLPALLCACSSSPSRMFFVVSHTISVHASFNVISSGTKSRKEMQTQDSPWWKLKKVSVHFDDDLSVFPQVVILLSLLTVHLRNEALGNKLLQKASHDFFIALQLHATCCGQISTSIQLQAKAPLGPVCRTGAVLPSRGRYGQGAAGMEGRNYLLSIAPWETSVSKL